jgi:membrane-bound serine protease (ClpP class)
MKRGAIILSIVAMACFLASARGQILSTQPTTAPAVAAAGSKTAIVELSGEIDDYNRDAFFRRFEAAKNLGAKVIIVDLDSYGGAVTSGLDISRFLKRQDDVHTVAFVKDKAISAGAMIAMACDEIVMSRSAALGDCAPIMIGPDNTLQTLGAAERAKFESPVLADFEESAARNHHDVLLARAMVAVQITVYWVQSPTGERKFVEEDEYKRLIDSGWTDVPGAKVPVDSDTTLLNLDSADAILYGVASGPVDSAEELAQQRAWPIIQTLRTSEGDQIVEVLGSPLVRGLLLVIFLSCANIVIHAPGHGVAEVLGLGALLLMLGVPMLTGYAQWWEILVIFLGLALVSVEILLPGHIVPGLTGAGLVAFGLVMTFVPREPTGMPGFLPSMNGTWMALEHGLAVVAGAMGVSLVIWYFMNRFLPKAPYFNRLILTTVSGGRTSGIPAAPIATGIWPVVGSVGRAVSELKPGGSAEFYDEAAAERRVTAVISDSGFVSPGESIVVQEVAGNRVIVRAAPRSA